jgi:hypothetical protein
MTPSSSSLPRLPSAFHCPFDPEQTAERSLSRIERAEAEDFAARILARSRVTQQLPRESRRQSDRLEGDGAARHEGRTPRSAKPTRRRGKVANEPRSYPLTPPAIALRHHYASVLLAAGESVIAVAEPLGHDDATLVPTTYGHLMPDSESRTRKAIDSAWNLDPADKLRTAGDHLHRSQWNVRRGGKRHPAAPTRRHQAATRSPVRSVVGSGYGHPAWSPWHAAANRGIQCPGRFPAVPRDLPRQRPSHGDRVAIPLIE